MNNTAVYANLNERFTVDLGRLVNAPTMEKKTRADGTEYKFAKIRVATDDGYSTNQGYKEHSSYFLMFIFDPQLAKTVMDFGRQGRLVTIEGNCHQTINQNNNKWFKLYEVTALEFLDTKDTGSDNAENANTTSVNTQNQNTSNNQTENQSAPKHEKHLSTMEKVDASIKKIQEKANKIAKDAHEKEQAEENTESYEDEQTNLFDEEK